MFFEDLFDFSLNIRVLERMQVPATDPAGPERPVSLRNTYGRLLPPTQRSRHDCIMQRSAPALCVSLIEVPGVIKSFGNGSGFTRWVDSYSAMSLELVGEYDEYMA